MRLLGSALLEYYTMVRIYFQQIHLSIFHSLPFTAAVCFLSPHIQYFSSEKEYKIRSFTGRHISFCKAS